jgi:hypothetical protein
MTESSCAFPPVARVCPEAGATAPQHHFESIATVQRAVTAPGASETPAGCEIARFCNLSATTDTKPPSDGDMLATRS